MPPFLPLERTLLHYYPRNWARHPCLSFIAAATFSSSSSTETTGVKTRSGRHKRPSVLEQNKLQEYLNRIDSSEDPTAEDIERHKPPKRAPPGTNQYETEYENLVKCLSRSFTVKQLRAAHTAFNLAIPSRSRKRDLAISIINRQWKWPSLSDSVKQRKEQTEIATQTFPLETREAFLLLGKDGSNLHLLSRKYNVRTSFVSDPLSLAVKGVRESVERLARYIRTFKTDIAENVVQLPTPQDVTLQLCQRVSRLSGALVETQDKQTLRVTYHGKEPRTSHIAKALVVCGAYESPESPPILACTGKDKSSLHVGEESRGFSLYPFSPAHPLPWNVVHGGIYRMRDVGWPDHNEMKHTTLLSNDHLTMDVDGKVEDLRKRLLPGITDIKKGINGCQASLGHVLLCVPSMAPNILMPPVTGNSSMPLLLQNVNRSEWQQVFMPSIPRHRLGLKPRRQRLVHRLIYHAIPTCEKNAVNEADAMSTESIKLEFVHNFSSVTEGYMDDESVAEDDELYDETLRISESGFWTGTESLVDLMLPERAMDLQLSTTNFKKTPESCWPNDLRKYMETLHGLSTSSLDASRANIPLIFSHNGTTFTLKSSSFIRQSSDPLFQGNEKTQVVSESILDLNSNQRYATCKIACEDPSEESWQQFLHACDLLTAHVSSATIEYRN